ncbi:hypothetical protein BT10792_07510 [Bacillus thuringiensis]|nr:hypothetical protein BT10792_07510 [Bacillus thuringiensis]
MHLTIYLLVNLMLFLLFK